jgi:uncharacterized membrane protein
MTATLANLWQRRLWSSIARQFEWKYLEAVVLFTLIVSILMACWVASQKRIFSNDELYSYYLLSDASFIHMLQAFHDKIHNAPPLYFILGWLWSKAFGFAPFSLRFFSSLGIALAALITWTTLRRVYGFYSTAIGTLAVFGSSSLIAFQNVEARMYGLFLALVAVLIRQFQQNCQTSESSRGLIVSNFCVNCALVQTHLFGFLYSAVFLLAQIFHDKRSGILRPKLYGAITLSWATLLLYLPSFVNQADAGSPRFWLPMTSFSDIVELLQITGPTPTKPIIIAVVAAALFNSGQIYGTNSLNMVHNYCSYGE